MKSKKRFLTFVAALVGIICIIVPTTLFLINDDNIENDEEAYYMFPNALFNKGTIVDMVLEDDNIIHFLVSSYNESYNTPAYLTINHSDMSCSYKEMFPSSWIGKPHQIRLGLTPDSQLISYLFCTDAFFTLNGRLYKLDGNTWVPYSPLEDFNNPYSRVYKRGVFDWTYMPSGDIVLAFVYEDGTSNTPAIYNETTNSFFLLRDNISEIQGFETVYYHGGLLIENNNIFLLWERYLEENRYHPYLAIKWGEEFWELSSLGSENDTLTPIAIFPQNDKVDVFYYDTGVFNNQSKLCLLEVYNSTVNTTTVVHQFDGKVFFDHESLKKLSPNEYIMFYEKSSFDPYSQYDLYMGYYNNQDFVETQLTNTADTVEVRTSCEVGEEYVHYLWASSEYKGTDTIDPYKTKIFYNRSRISDIKQQVINKRLQDKVVQLNDSSHNSMYDYLFFFNKKILILIPKTLYFCS